MSNLLMVNIVNIEDITVIPIKCQIQDHNGLETGLQRFTDNLY